MEGGSLRLPRIQAVGVRQEENKKSEKKTPTQTKKNLQLCETAAVEPLFWSSTLVRLNCCVTKKGGKNYPGFSGVVLHLTWGTIGKYEAP